MYVLTYITVVLVKKLPEKKVSCYGQKKSDRENHEKLKEG